MISLERSPQNAAQAIDLITEGSVDLIVPRIDFLPDKIQDKPGILLPHEVISVDHPELAIYGETPVWGGVQSEEDVTLSTFYIVGVVETEVAQHYIALMNALSFGEDPRLIRSVLENARKADQEIHQKLGSLILTSSTVLEPAYCQSDKETRENFLRSTGYHMEGHKTRLRAEGGEVLFMLDVLEGVQQGILQRGSYVSEILQAEIPHDFDGVARVTRHIGKPYALPLQDRVLSVGITKEPRHPKKPHTCAGCHLHIAPGALRATVNVEPRNNRFDHHHFHVRHI